MLERPDPRTEFIVELRSMILTAIARIELLDEEQLRSLDAWLDRTTCRDNERLVLEAFRKFAAGHIGADREAGWPKEEQR